MEKLMATVKVVRQEIELIKEQMDDTVIDVAGQRLNTKRELQAWLVILTDAKRATSERKNGHTHLVSGRVGTTRIGMARVW
jgi:hypothetical protein